MEIASPTAIILVKATRINYDWNDAPFQRYDLYEGMRVIDKKIDENDQIPRQINPEVQGHSMATTPTGTFDILCKCRWRYRKVNKYRHITDTHLSKTHSSQ